jgi:hypothetical protein
MQRAEEELLRAAGFSVKNTFIDEPQHSTRAPRRAASAPPQLTRYPSPELNISADGGTEFDSRALLQGERCAGPGSLDGPNRGASGKCEHTCPNSDAGSPGFADEKREPLETSTSPPSTCCDLSSTWVDDASECTWSDATDSEGGTLDTASKCSEEHEARLAMLVQRECRFLQIVDSSLQLLEAADLKRLPLKCVTHCLRVSVDGLPSLKRHRWQQPLLLSVAAILQRVGCAAFVRRGELFAPVDGASSEILVRVDLCAPRRAEGRGHARR